MKSTAAAFLLCFGLRAQTASIEGVTVNSITGEAIAGVHVRLVTGNVSTITATYGAISDRQGRFSIAAIRPATYIPVPERNGYLFTRGGSRDMPSLALRPGQQLTGVRLELAPRAILSGRVLDEFGDPVQGSFISAIPVDPENPMPINPIQTLGTDDRGEFRIVTVPGRYYLEAMANQGQGTDQPEILPDGSKVVPYHTTFYPSAVTKDRATAVAAVGGKEVSGLDVRLVRQKGLSVSGIVSGMPEHALAGITLQSGQKPGTFYSYRRSSTGSDGRFEIGLPGGETSYYRIWAHFYGKPVLFSNIVEFQSASADVSNLELRLAPAGEVTGSLEIEGVPTGTTAPGTSVTLYEVTGNFNSSEINAGEVDSQGAFRLGGVGPGKYRVKMQPFPETAYIQKVMRDGIEAPEGVLDFDHGIRSARIQVTVSLRGGLIGGRILDENGEPLLTPTPMVILVPAGKKGTLEAESFGRVQADGRYSFKNVKPGRYRLAAFDTFRINPNTLSDLAKLGEQGEEIEVQEAARIVKDVRLPPKESGNAKPR